MLDFRVVIAACVAGVVILLGGIGLVASVRIAHEPARPASRIVERPRAEPNASLPVVIETPVTRRAPAREVVQPPEPVAAPVTAAAPAPVVTPIVPPVIAPIEARAPAPSPVQPAATEITGSITQPDPVALAPTAPARAGPAPSAADLPTTVPVEHPQATSGLPPSAATAKRAPRRPRPAAPADNLNPFSAIFGGFTQ